MFKTLRVNSLIYILNRTYNPVLETGVVLSVSPPRLGQINQSNPYMPAPMVVDIVAQFGGEKRNLNGLPADNTTFDFPAGNMMVTEDKNVITNEIKGLFQQEEAKVNGYEHSKELMTIYSNMLMTLDPDAMERKKNSDKISQLEQSLSQQSKINEQILAQLEAMSAQNRELVNQLEATKLNKNKTQKNEKNENV